MRFWAMLFAAIVTSGVLAAANDVEVRGRPEALVVTTTGAPIQVVLARIASTFGADLTVHGQLTGTVTGEYRGEVAEVLRALLGDRALIVVRSRGTPTRVLVFDAPGTAVLGAQTGAGGLAATTARVPVAQPSVAPTRSAASQPTERRTSTPMAASEQSQTPVNVSVEAADRLSILQRAGAQFDTMRRALVATCPANTHC